MKVLEVTRSLTDALVGRIVSSQQRQSPSQPQASSEFANVFTSVETDGMEDEAFQLEVLLKTQVALLDMPVLRKTFKKHTAGAYRTGLLMVKTRPEVALQALLALRVALLRPNSHVPSAAGAGVAGGGASASNASNASNVSNASASNSSPAEDGESLGGGVGGGGTSVKISKSDDDDTTANR